MAAVSAPAVHDPRATQLGMTSIGLVAAGVIYLAAYLPRHAPLGTAIALLAAALLVLGINFVLLLRRPGFAWWRFKQVFGWLLLAYSVVVAMIIYAFIYDHTPGKDLAVAIGLLITFVLNVAFVPAFTVARYEQPR